VVVSSEEFPRPLTAAGARATSAIDGPPYPPDVRDEEIAMVLDAEFPIALRGYERASVDAYVHKVSRVIAELEASRSPQSAIRYALEKVSEETRAILQQAHDSADAVISKSRAEADERLQRAERESAALKVNAERRVAELEDELADLWQERQRLLEEMRDVSLRMHDVVVGAAEREPPAALVELPADGIDPIEPVDAAAVGWVEPGDEGFDDDQPPQPVLSAVPPPPEDAEAEPALADAPPPLAEEAAGPVAFEDELVLDPLDEPAAPIAADGDQPTEPFDPVPEWEDEPADDPMRLELRGDGENDDPDDDLDTAEREPPR
jgi:hypothetical protein